MENNMENNIVNDIPPKPTPPGRRKAAERKVNTPSRPVSKVGRGAKNTNESLIIDTQDNINSGCEADSESTDSEDNNVNIDSKGIIKKGPGKRGVRAKKAVGEPTRRVVVKAAAKNAAKTIAEYSKPVDVMGRAVPKYRADIQQLMREAIDRYNAEYKCGANDDNIKQIVRKIERSCYNKTIISCKNNYIEAEIENKDFIHRYSIECSKILYNIDYTSSVNNISFIKRILEGNIDLDKISDLKHEDMHPEISHSDREKIKTRMMQQLEKKYVKGKLCRKCKHETVSYTEVQTRATDEGGALRYECGTCGFPWFES